MNGGVSDRRAAAGERFLEALEGEGLSVVACYWRRLRPTRDQWALVVSLREFEETLEPALSRVIDLWDERQLEWTELRAFNLWALEPEAHEPARYARLLRGGPWPRTYSGDHELPPAYAYRLPPA